MLELVLMNVLIPTTPNPRHDAVYKFVGNLLQRGMYYKRKHLLCMFPAGQSRVIPWRPAYGLPGQKQV